MCLLVEANEKIDTNLKLSVFSPQGLRQFFMLWS